MHSKLLKGTLIIVIRFFLLFLSVFCFCSQAYASPPVPGRKKTPEIIKQDLQAQKQQQAELEKKSKAIESELEDLRGDLVSTAKDVQDNEKTLLELEDGMRALEAEKSQIQGRLENDRKSISHLILALQRISRVPPQALIAQPDAPLKTAQSHMLMRDIIPALHKQAQELQTNIERLDRISEEMALKKERTIEASKILHKEQKRLETLASKKESLYREANKDLRAQEIMVERISLQAKNLQDLVYRLERNNEEERSRNLTGQAIKRPKGSIPSAGTGRLPVPGAITIAFNEPDNFGAPSQGLTIKGRSGSLVTAPMGGVVRFVGPFKNYGNMVIIEHQNKYHSLIAGFEKIDTLVGQKVTAGEPLGKMFSEKSGKTPKIYYELRHDGTPVNPAEKISGMG